MKRVFYHKCVVDCIHELERLQLGKFPDQIQSELHDRVARCQDLLKKITMLVPEVAPVEKSAKRLEREQELAQRKQREEIK